MPPKKRGRPSRLHTALGQIKSFFEGLPRKAFMERELLGIFLQHRDEWRVGVWPRSLALEAGEAPNLNWQEEAHGPA